MSTVTLHVGDVFERMAELPDGSVDLIVTSPPFLALRSYLPADHPDKAREIGSEATPADFLDTLLRLTAEWRRVLAPHGSICVELGDTYSGSGGAGGDYGENGLRKGQPKFQQAHDRPQDGGYDAGQRVQYDGYRAGIRNMNDKHQGGGPGWPLAKSLTGIPTLYAWSLAYGRNLLTGQPSPAGQWRIRNLLVWARPNPPVGALGDKFRPATSYITVATTAARRWFDLDAVRTEYKPQSGAALYPPKNFRGAPGGRRDGGVTDRSYMDGAGAPPLDWHQDGDDGPTGDRLWIMPTQPYRGAHYATYPTELPRRLIEAMCPRFVCRVCGKARERIVERGELRATPSARIKAWDRGKLDDGGDGMAAALRINGFIPNHEKPSTTLGWSDCGHDNYRPGIVCDPYAGSGTTLAVAAQLGRDAIGIDLDLRNADLVDRRIGEMNHIIRTTYSDARRRTNQQGRAGRTPWLPPNEKGRYGPNPNPKPLPMWRSVTWSCEPSLPDQKNQIDGQTNLLDLLSCNA